MKKLVAGLMSVVFAVVYVSAASSQVVDKAASQAVSKTVVDKTLAVVNGETVLESEFNSLFLPMLEQYKQNMPASNQTVQEETGLKNYILNQMIESVLLKQEANKHKIKVSKKELQDNVSAIKKLLANESEFVAGLKKGNITMADFEKRLSEQIAIKKLKKQFVDHKIKRPSEIEAKDLYDKIVMKMKGTKTNLSPEEDAFVSNLAKVMEMMNGEKVRLRQIFVNCPKDANETTLKAAQAKIATIKKELQKQTFADIAAQYSEDSVSKARNGDLGIVTKGYIAPPSLNKVVFSMQVGDYTKDPIKTDAGYLFVKVEEKHAKKDMTFANVKNDVIEMLREDNEDRAHIDYINTLKSKASIKINKTW
ncbi:MAG: SurA N-terminal domain-containing protein [Endomicrobium sp.]|nr:SurA N-terminal domain-containing protein [Endomicrobium sp.]